MCMRVYVRRYPVLLHGGTFCLSSVSLVVDVYACLCQALPSAAPGRDVGRQDESHHVARRRVRQPLRAHQQPPAHRPTGVRGHVRGRPHHRATRLQRRSGAAPPRPAPPRPAPPSPAPPRSAQPRPAQPSRAQPRPAQPSPTPPSPSHKHPSPAHRPTWVRGHLRGRPHHGATRLQRRSDTPSPYLTPLAHSTPHTNTHHNNSNYIFIRTRRTRNAWRETVILSTVGFRHNFCARWTVEQ